MGQLMLALACFLLLILPSSRYLSAPPGIPQDVWDLLTEMDTRPEALGVTYYYDENEPNSATWLPIDKVQAEITAKQSQMIAPRLDIYRKTVEELIH